MPPEGHTFGEVVACNLLFLSNFGIWDWYLLAKRGFDILASWPPNPQIICFDWGSKAALDLDKFCLVCRLRGKCDSEKELYVLLWSLPSGHKFHCEKYLTACMSPKKGNGVYGPPAYRHPHPHPSRRRRWRGRPEHVPADAPPGQGAGHQPYIRHAPQQRL